MTETKERINHIYAFMYADDRDEMGILNAIKAAETLEGRTIIYSDYHATNYAKSVVKPDHIEIQQPPPEEDE